MILEIIAAIIGIVLGCILFHYFTKGLEASDKAYIREMNNRIIIKGLQLGIPKEEIKKWLVKEE